MNCKNYRTRTKKKIKYGYCTKYRKQVFLFCKECKENIEYKDYKSLKSRTYKQTKAEKNRYSILQKNTNKCIICDSPYNLTWHEVFRGRNRANSIKYALCLRICQNCHEANQESKKFNELWHKIAQEKAMEYYHWSVEDFIKIFRRNYL